MKPKTAPIRLPNKVVAEALAFGRGRTPGESLAIAWREFLAKHDAEIDQWEDEARAKRKRMIAERQKPKPDGGKTYA
jgi:hypothetical protein